VQPARARLAPRRRKRCQRLRARAREQALAASITAFNCALNSGAPSFTRSPLTVWVPRPCPTAAPPRAQAAAVEPTPLPPLKPPPRRAGNRAVCPGIAGGVCALPCQRVICGALSDFLAITYNASLPWNNVTGWELTTTLGCGRLVTPAAAARPPFCGWPGLACCEPRQAALGHCSVINAVANITMPVDQVNVSLSNAGFLDTLEQLHACGLVVLDLEANELTGTISPRFGALHNLRVLNVGASPRPGRGWAGCPRGPPAPARSRGGGSSRCRGPWPSCRPSRAAARRRRRAAVLQATACALGRP
jgi:hypothetical protein